MVERNLFVPSLRGKFIWDSFRALEQYRGLFLHARIAYLYAGILWNRQCFVKHKKYGDITYPMPILLDAAEMQDSWARGFQQAFCATAQMLESQKVKAGGRKTKKRKLTMFKDLTRDINAVKASAQEFLASAPAQFLQCALDDLPQKFFTQKDMRTKHDDEVVWPG